MASLPLIIEPDELEHVLTDDSVLIVDLCKPEQYTSAHIPGAVHLDYIQIISGEKPVMGRLPTAEKLNEVFSSIGLTPDTHVVAYDDEGGGRAARLIWTLHCVGHYNTSLLNGGLFSWANEGHSLSVEPAHPTPTDYIVSFDPAPLAKHDYIHSRLNAADLGLLDARSLDEFTGTKAFAARGGHIPGAKRFEWTDAMDKNHNMRLLPADQLQTRLDSLGLTPDKEIICYCQTHHRSALSYVMLKFLGYENVKGYPASWSDWGNRPDMPIESGE